MARQRRARLDSPSGFERWSRPAEFAVDDSEEAAAAKKLSGKGKDKGKSKDSGKDKGAAGGAAAAASTEEAGSDFQTLEERLELLNMMARGEIEVEGDSSSDEDVIPRWQSGWRTSWTPS